MFSRYYNGTSLTIMDSIIEATNANSQFVGGAFAYNYRNIKEIAVIRTQVLSKGDFVGGISGSSDFSHDFSNEKTIYNAVVLDSTITGNNYVGGIAGYNNVIQTTDAYVART